MKPTHIAGLVAVVAVIAVVVGVAIAGGYPDTMSDAATASYESDGESRTIHVGRDPFEDAIQEIQANPVFADAYREVVGEIAEASVSTDLAAGWMSYVLVQSVFDAEFEARNLAIDDSTQSRARREAATVFAANGDIWAGLEVFDAFDPEFQDELIAAKQRELALREELGGSEEIEEPTEAEVAEFVDANQELIDSCPSGRYYETIVAPTMEHATGVLDELEAGEDFSTLSEFYAGASGCVPEADPTAEPDPLLAAVLEADVDTVVGPLEATGQDGAPQYFLVQVSDFATAELRQQRRAEVSNVRAGGTDAVMQEIYGSLKVRTDPRYGSWDPEQATVLPPVFTPPRSQRESRPEADPVLTAERRVPE